MLSLFEYGGMMEFDLRFSDKEITAWGGMAVMKRMLEHLKFDAALMACGLPQPGSNRGYRRQWCGKVNAIEIYSRRR